MNEKNNIEEKWLNTIGINNTTSYWNLTPDQLTEETIRLKQGVLTDTNALAVDTGEFTGRSPKDKFIVLDDKTKQIVENLIKVTKILLKNPNVPVYYEDGWLQLGKHLHPRCVYCNKDLKQIRSHDFTINNSQVMEKEKFAALFKQLEKISAFLQVQGRVRHVSWWSVFFI